MTLALPRRLLVRSLLSLSLALATAGIVRAQPDAGAAKAPPPRLPLKNAQSIRVTVGNRRHEPASGIRPDKGVWNVVPKNDLSGASAELVDLTPNAPRSRWVMDIEGDKLVLDARRFLPSHVYQLDVRKEKKLVGTALVYLYPPATGSTEKVEFKDEETKKGESDDVTRVPKGEL
jgi:hypothetical protein